MNGGTAAADILSKLKGSLNTEDYAFAVQLLREPTADERRESRSGMDTRTVQGAAL